MRGRAVLVLRILLGLVFLYAAYTKLRQPWLLFALSIDAYRLLPSWAVFSVARTLPWIEVALGLMLLTGFLLRWAAPAASVLLLAFYGAMIHAYAAGGGIDCGCFGAGEAVSIKTLLRDGALVAGALVLSVVVWTERRTLTPWDRSQATSSSGKGYSAPGQATPPSA